MGANPSYAKVPFDTTVYAAFAIDVNVTTIITLGLWLVPSHIHDH